MPSGDERRSTPRYVVDLPVRFWTSEEGEALSGRIRDVSWGGLFLASAQMQPAGASIKLVVAMSRRGGEVVPLSGSVAWTGVDTVKGPGMGIRLDTPL